MPSYVLKPVPDRDEYVVWSTIVDAITWWGSAEVLMKENSDVTQDRIDRANKLGTSSYNLYFDYRKEEFICQNFDGLHNDSSWIKIKRENLYEFAGGSLEVAESLSYPFEFED